MTTALEPAGEYRLAIAETETEDLAELIQINLGGEITAKDLDRITVPGGGSTVWEVPGADGVGHAPELVGVVVHFHDHKGFWPKSIEDGGGGAPPQCYSDDCRVGIGDPGGECRVCPYNQFGSARNGTGKGKACKDIRDLYLVMGDDALPCIVSAPSSSLDNVRRYFAQLAKRRLPMYGAVTRLTLNKTRSDSGISYSEIVATMVRALSDEERARVRVYASGIAAAAQQMRQRPALQEGDAGAADQDADYWRRTAMSRYQDAGGDPANQEQCRADFNKILCGEPDRSRTTYSAEDWAEIAIHYSGAPVQPASAPDGAEEVTEGEVESLFASEPAGPKGRAKKAVEAGERSDFAQQSGL